MHLIIDTETTGQAVYGTTDYGKQPHLVQVGLILYDDARKIRGEFNAIVKPDGWSIPDEVAEIHGITEDIAERFGIPRRTVLSAVRNFANAATVVSSFNWAFDGLILDAAFSREVGHPFLAEGDKTRYCTMKPCTWICQIPKPEWQLAKYGRHDPFKWPKLMEAYHFIFGEEFDGAHDAMADVRAAARIYFYLLDKGIPDTYRGEIPIAKIVAGFDSTVNQSIDVTITNADPDRFALAECRYAWCPNPMICQANGCQEKSDVPI